MHRMTGSSVTTKPDSFLPVGPRAAAANPPKEPTGYGKEYERTYDVLTRNPARGLVVARRLEGVAALELCVEDGCSKSARKDAAVVGEIDSSASSCFRLAALAALKDSGAGVRTERWCSTGANAGASSFKASAARGVRLKLGKDCRFVRVKTLCFTSCFSLL
jgi:hypothetical protein